MNLSVNPILEVTASIADKDGKPAPLAGQIFYALERDPSDILQENDLTSEISYARTMNALRNLAIRFCITGPEGKGKITQLRSKAFYICGICHTPQKAGVWNVEIELLPGKNNLVFNDENMTT
jgi:hypothetical protein